MIIAFIDPYKYLNFSHIIDDETKIKVLRRSDAVMPRGSMLWKSLDFKREPIKNIIIGDSQGTSIDESLLESLTGEKYFNFCVPGSSYETMIDCFWFCAENADLKNVYFQIGFMNFNKNRSYNLINYAKDYFDKPYLYFINKEILFDSFYNLAYGLTKSENIISRESNDYTIEQQDELSQHYLFMFFNNYEYPDEYLLEFEEIAAHCSENNIKLNFVIMPIYYEVFKYLETHNLIMMEKIFKKDMAQFGNVHDYSFVPQFSNERENFYDFFHPRNPVVETVVHEIWSR